MGKTTWQDMYDAYSLLANGYRKEYAEEPTISKYASIGIIVEWHHCYDNTYQHHLIRVRALDQITGIRCDTQTPLYERKMLEYTLLDTAENLRSKRLRIASCYRELLSTGDHFERICLFGEWAEMAWGLLYKLARFDKSFRMHFSGMYDLETAWHEITECWEPKNYDTIRKNSQKWVEPLKLANSCKTFEEYSMKAALRGDTCIYKRREFEIIDDIIPLFKRKYDGN